MVLETFQLLGSQARCPKQYAMLFHKHVSSIALSMGLRKLKGRRPKHCSDPAVYS